MSKQCQWISHQWQQYLPRLISANWGTLYKNLLEACACACMSHIFLGDIRLIGQPKKNFGYAWLPLEVSTKSICSSLLTFYSFSRVSRHKQKIFLASLASIPPPNNVSSIFSEKCVQENNLSGALQIGTKIPMHVKSAMSEFYISSGGLFKQLWCGDW